MTNLEKLRAKPNIHNNGKYIHGMTKTRPYKIWSGIMRRCYNKNEKCYSRYGGKGILVSKSWKNFVNFWNDMESTYFDKCSIDRINNNKGYSKENCRWVKLSEQSKNRRNVILYEHNGEKLSASDWDRKLGLKIGSVKMRINKYN